jgi:phosphoribosylanthranilate isomerase
MFRTRIKICGLTRSQDVRAAVDSGADAIGFVFYPPSPRAVSIEQAAELVALLPPFVVSVGLFVNPAPGEVEAVLARVPLQLLQFHGDESESVDGYGGGGRTFDWTLIPAGFKRPLVLSGGLDADNVGDAVRSVSARGRWMCRAGSRVPRESRTRT